MTVGRSAGNEKEEPEVEVPVVESGAGKSSRKSQKKKYSRKNIPLPTRHIVSYRMQNPAVPVVSMHVPSVRPIHTC